MRALPRGVVFDMDGTLLDTERLARACFEQACRDVGWEPDLPLYDQCVGTTHEATEALLRQGYGPAFPYTDFQARWSQHYNAHVQHRPVDLKPGITELLSELAGRGIPLCIATSSRRPAVEVKLRLAELTHFFDFYVCGGEAAAGKPHPAPYLHAVERLGFTPAECWAVEDSDNGVRSAVAAGLQVFQIPDLLAPGPAMRDLGHQLLPDAHALVDTLVGLDPR